MRPRPSGSTRHELEAHINLLRSTIPARHVFLDALEQIECSKPADTLTVNAHGRQCRLELACEIKVSETGHRQIARYIDASLTSFDNGSQRKQVAAAGHRINVGRLGEKLTQSLTPLASRSR